MGMLEWRVCFASVSIPAPRLLALITDARDEASDEVDYSGYEWFKDPPPPPQVNLRLQGILDTRV